MDEDPATISIAFAEDKVDGVAVLHNDHPPVTSKVQNVRAERVIAKFSGGDWGVAELQVWAYLVIGFRIAKAVVQFGRGKAEDAIHGPSIVGHCAECGVEVHVVVQTMLPEDV
jgi:hypothetical protein